MMNRFESIKRLETTFQVESYQKFDLDVAKARGARLWTSDGTEYIDLYGGHAVCATGHSHPHVVSAITEQARKVIFYSNAVYADIRAQAAEKLALAAPESLRKVFFCNSGTEANENAMRMARITTGRDRIVSLSGGFHGRTADSISATFLGQYRDIGRPNVPEHAVADFGDIESVSTAADTSTAAIILEPIQSMAGVREAPPDFFTDLRKLCDDRGIVLIFDEVQTGIGRTGSWFFAGSTNAGGVVPDVVTLAKSIASGVPAGACIANESIAKCIKQNDLGTTFGGGMLAMAAVLATLEAIESDEMMQNALAIEACVRKIAAAKREVRSVRGKGCLLGIELDKPAQGVQAALLEKRVITGTSSDKNVLRLLPPLCTTHDDLEGFAEAFQDA